MEGDGEANYAHYALHKFKIRPKELVDMDRKEKAFIFASIDIHIEAEKKAQSKAKIRKK